MASYYNDTTVIYLNGEFVKASEAKMDLYSQSLHYGYSVFECISRLLQPVIMFNSFEYSCFATHGFIRTDAFKYGIAIMKRLAIEVHRRFGSFHELTVQEQNCFIVVVCHKKKPIQTFPKGRL